MSDPSLIRHRVARGGALVCSLALGMFVIVNAQLGCDAPATTEPPPASPAAKGEPAPTDEPAKVEPAAKIEPAANAEAPEPNVAPLAPPEVEPAAEPASASNKKGGNAEPVYMPASKSGGDFGAMQFPGQGQINPAPEPTPQQQAVQK
jgi:hypothetical protein